jgi:hypothetical protein
MWMRQTSGPPRPGLDPGLNLWIGFAGLDAALRPGLVGVAPLR